MHGDQASIQRGHPQKSVDFPRQRTPDRLIGGGCSPSRATDVPAIQQRTRRTRFPQSATHRPFQALICIYKQRCDIDASDNEFKLVFLRRSVLADFQRVLYLICWARRHTSNDRHQQLESYDTCGIGKTPDNWEDSSRNPIWFVNSQHRII